jgi:phosphatidylinositol glycan class B
MQISVRSRTTLPILAAICLLGLVLRLALALRYPGVAHPDETFQYLEQANRVVTGRGMIPWEYIAQVRSWLIPGLLVPVIAIVRSMSITPDATNLAIAVTSSLLSLAVIVSAFVLSPRENGTFGALCTACLVAFWPEILYLSPHILPDTLSAVTLISGLAFGYRNAPTDRALAASGFFLAITVLLRPQLAPAVMIAWFWIGGFADWRRYIPLAISGLMAVTIFGLIDWLTLGAPFQSIYRYVVANSAGVASSFGVSNNRYYIGSEADLWGFALVPIIFTAVLGARRSPLIAVVGAVILLTFSLVGHKEDRFIYPAIPLVFILCGIGTGEIINNWRVRTRGRKHWVINAVALSLWACTALYVGAWPAMAVRFQKGAGTLSAIHLINGDPSICSVAVDPPSGWWRTGLIRFRQDLKLYELGDPPLAGPQAYNAILSLPAASRGAEYRSAGFVPAGCFTAGERACLFRRASLCNPKLGHLLGAAPDEGVVRVLKRIGFPSQ